MRASRFSPVRILTVAVTITALAALVAGPSSAATSAARPMRTSTARSTRSWGATTARPASPSSCSVARRRCVHTAGVADTATKAPITIDDSMRLASVAKAFSGAAALALVADGSLKLDDTVGDTCPTSRPRGRRSRSVSCCSTRAASPTSASPMGSRMRSRASLEVAPPPAELLSYVAEDPLRFTPGTKYEYSNSDNILVGLMVQAVTGNTLEDELGTPGVRTARARGHQPPGGDGDPGADHPRLRARAARAAGRRHPGVRGRVDLGLGRRCVDAERRQLVRARLRIRADHESGDASQQFRFREGSSEPPGPGTNSAGMAIFRYRTRCGVVFGHTGNTAGYTQFVASTRTASVRWSCR